jgi:hypothetical protein
MEKALPLDFVDYDPAVEISGDISKMSALEYLSWVRYVRLILTFLYNFNIYNTYTFTGIKQSVFLKLLEQILILFD